MYFYSGVDEFCEKGVIVLKYVLVVNKLMFFEEFGVIGKIKFEEIVKYIVVFNDFWVLWMLWQMSKFGNGEVDFEFWIDEFMYEVVRREVKKVVKFKVVQCWNLCDGWLRQVF